MGLKNLNTESFLRKTRKVLPKTYIRVGKIKHNIHITDIRYRYTADNDVIEVNEIKKSPKWWKRLWS